jgi:hypothetical protein
MKLTLKMSLIALLTVSMGALGLMGCVVEDDYTCDDGEVLANVGDVACDGVVDCLDGSDEVGCGVVDYVCDDGEVLADAGDVACDDVYDCTDLSDELGCGGCAADEVNCLVGGVDDCAVQCDDVVECDDGFDEDSCH